MQSDLTDIISSTPSVSMVRSIKPLWASQINMEERDTKGRTALMNQAEKGCVAALQWLLAAGANKDVRDYQGKTALMYAAEKCPEAASRLLAVGADIKARDYHGKTPLMYAAGCPEVVQWLLAAGADKDVRDHDDRTALMYAAGRCPEVVSQLLAKGADILVRDRYGSTALECVQGRDAAKVLLEAGARVMYSRYCSSLSLYKIVHKAIVKHVNSYPLIALLNTTYTNSCSVYLEKTKNEIEDIIEKINLKTVHVNEQTPCGYTAMMAAVENGSTEIIDAMIKAGANINARCNGRTAIMRVHGPNGFMIACLLLQAGAVIEANDTIDLPSFNILQKNVHHLAEKMTIGDLRYLEENVRGLPSEQELFKGIREIYHTIRNKALMGQYNNIEKNLCDSREFADRVRLSNVDMDRKTLHRLYSVVTIEHIERTEVLRALQYAEGWNILGLMKAYYYIESPYEGDVEHAITAIMGLPKTDSVYLNRVKKDIIGYCIYVILMQYGENAPKEYSKTKREQWVAILLDRYIAHGIALAEDEDIFDVLHTVYAIKQSPDLTDAQRESLHRYSQKLECLLAIRPHCTDNLAFIVKYLINLFKKFSSNMLHGHYIAKDSCHSVHGAPFCLDGIGLVQHGVFAISPQSKHTVESIAYETKRLESYTKY